MTHIKETLHKLEHGLLHSEDSNADLKAKEAKDREAAAQAKLDSLQSKGTSGDDVDNKQLSSVPSSSFGIDQTNMIHQSPNVQLHEAADYTALRPESQEKADGTGTAGDDLAI